MRDRDRLQAAEALDQRHRRGIQQSRRSPTNIAVRRADEQRALADGEGGCVPMPITPGSYSRNALKCSRRSAASVVQVWPRGGTYCRSSSQIVHCGGRRVARRILRAAGGADVKGHGISLRVGFMLIGRASLLRGEVY